MLHSTTVTAYKVLALREDGLHPSRIVRESRPLPVGEWIVDQVTPGDEMCWATSKEAALTGVQSYPRGFHAFARQADAERESCASPALRVYEVRMEDIVAEVADPLGLTTSCGPAPIVVGRRMFIVGPAAEEFELGELEFDLELEVVS
jgi:hypothetical protein